MEAGLLSQCCGWEAWVTVRALAYARAHTHRPTCSHTQVRAPSHSDMGQGGQGTHTATVFGRGVL